MISRFPEDTPTTTPPASSPASAAAGPAKNPATKNSSTPSEPGSPDSPLHPPATAPLDQVILAHVGLPWLVTAIYNPHVRAWAYATLQACPMQDGTFDTYFETDNEKTIIGWLPLPSIHQKK
jgi:hypothetical protein